MSDFEKFWSDTDEDLFQEHAKREFKTAYEAGKAKGFDLGRRTGLEEAAEIAVATGSLGNTDAGFDMADRIAAAIGGRITYKQTI